MIWLSSTIAKCCSVLPAPGSAAFSPRWAISLVTFSKTDPPWEVKSNVTSGAPLPPAPFSKPCAGFLMSEPLSTGSSLSTYQLLGEALRTLPVVVLSSGRAWASTVPGLTRTSLTLAPAGGL